MKKIVLNNRILFCAIVIAIVFCTVFFSVQDLSHIAFAGSVSFDDSNVLDDLKSSTINGESFDILDYPFDENGDISIVNFVEYCYSYKVNMRSNYGLYIYLYNPKGLDIDTSSKQNKVQMAVSWVKNEDGTYSADRYEKFNLKFCNESSDSNYKSLFYKFKVIDREIDGATMVDRVNSNERRYDISGIELLTKGSVNATDYTIGGTYKFTGYAQGYGNSDENTLSCVVQDLETLKLEVHSTYYRTGVSSPGEGHYNEVNSVYFSVPDRIFNMYGNLQKIRAEWWEYKIKPALVLNDESFFNLATQYTGQEVKNYSPDGDYLTRLYDQSIPFNAYSLNELLEGSVSYYWTFNVDLLDWKAGNVGKDWEKTCDNVSNLLPFVFYSPAENIDSVFSFLYSKQVAGDVASSVVEDYVYNYSNELGNGYIDCNGRQISKDLFIDSVDDGRIMGHNDQTIDFGDTFDLKSYDSNHSWWEKLWTFGFSWPETDEHYENVQPIYEVKADDLLFTDDVVSSRLLINKDDVSDFRTYYTAESIKGNHVILFRFANTDYFCQNAFMQKANGNGSTGGYIAQMTWFFDFDIIELTFNKDGNYRVIPAVSSPIDIVNGISAPPVSFEWWKLVLMIIGFLLGILLLAPILPYIIKAVIWVISLPFKAIAGIVKSVKKQN